MVMTGKINKELVTALQSQGIRSVGLSGLDGLLVQAKRKKRLVIIDEKGKKRVIDGGYTGKIEKINKEVLSLLLKNNFIPVISPVATSENYEMLNVDGDRMAAYLAGSLQADKLILLTDVKGIMLEGKIIPKMNISEAQAKLSNIGKGMITKLYAAIEALEQNVKEVIIASGLIDKPILSALKYEERTVINLE
jgi:acetylglutamate/LysW-gamma-L-alpha-aminoadipate kinase